jgi:hypothetical protein
MRQRENSLSTDRASVRPSYIFRYPRVVPLGPRLAVQEIIQEAESMLTQLTTTLTKVTDQIEEAITTIQEIDKATTVIADFTDVAEESRIEFIKIAEKHPKPKHDKMLKP